MYYKEKKIISLFATRYNLMLTKHEEYYELLLSNTSHLFYFHDSHISVTLEANYNYSEHTNLYDCTISKYLKEYVEPYV